MKKLKKRYIIETLFFIAIVALSLIIFLPAKKALETQIKEVKELVIKNIEDEYGVRINYSSIYPSFFKKIVIRDISIYNSENNEKLAYFSVIHLEYRFFELLKKNPLSIFSKVRIYDGDINFNTIKNNNIVKKLQSDDESDNNKSTTIKSDNYYINQSIKKLENSVKNFKDKLLPLEVSLHNIVVNYSNQSLSSKLYVFEGKLNIDAEKADFNLNSKFFHNDADSTNADAKLNASGSFYKDSFSAFSLLSFSDINVNNVQIKSMSVFMSYKDNVISLNTVQDVYPIDISAFWDIRNENAKLDIDCKDFFPFSLISSGIQNLEDLKKLSVTGKFSLNFSNRDKFDWKTNALVNVPKIELAGSIYRKTMLKLDVNGDNSLLNLNSLAMSGDDVDIFADGSYKFKTLLPKFNLRAKKIKLPSGKNLVGNLKINSRGKKIFAYIPNLRIGTSSLRNINAILETKVKKSDFYISAKDKSGLISLDGSWIHPDSTVKKNNLSKTNLGYLECHGAVDSISMENIVDMADSMAKNGLGLSKSVENFVSSIKATSEFYLSTDFDQLSYSVVQMILASGKENGFYAVSSINGNQNSFNINISDLSFSNFNISANMNSGFENDSFIFNSLMTVNNVSYKLNGMYSENLLNVYGDYGLNINVMNEDSLRGSVQAKGLPIPFLNLLASIDTTFDFKTVKDWGVNFNQLKFEAINSELSSVNNNFEFDIAGIAKPKQVFLHSVKIGKKQAQLFGSASLNLQPSTDQKIKTYSANIALTDLKESEKFTFESLISVSDKIYFDGTSKFENISFNRFFSSQRKRNKLDADLAFLGSKDSFTAKLDLKKLNFRLDGEDLVLKTILMADDKQLALSDTDISYGIHKIKNVKALLEPARKSGDLSFDYSADLKEEEIKASFDFQFKALDSIESANSESTNKDELDSRNIIEKVEDMLANYTVKMAINDWVMGQKKGKEPFVASLVREPRLTAIYAGKDDSSYAFKTSDGIVSVHIDEKLPVHLDINGSISDDLINLSCSNVFADVAEIMNYLPETNIVKFNTGFLSGDLEISGSTKEPEFNGVLTVKALTGSSPKYTPDDYGPVNIPIFLKGTKLTVPRILIHGKKGTLWGEVDSEFIGWLPMDTEIRCGVLTDTGLLDTSNLAYTAKGNATCNLVMNIQPNYMSLVGDAYFDKGYFSVPFAELDKLAEKYTPEDGRADDFKFEMNLNLHLGKNTEFRFPSSNFPILSAYAYTEEPLVLKVGIDGVDFEITGSAKIRTGELFYVKRNFHIKEGDLYITKTPLGTIEPFVSLNAEIRDKTSKGEPLTITLTAKDQILDINKFTPQITSVPPMSDIETMMLLGQAFTGGSDKDNILKETLINTSDIFAQMGLVKKVERGIRDFLNVDVFSVRTLLLQNMVIGNLFNISKGDDLTIGNYFDNTSVYIGKYLGSAMYADASLHLSYYDPLLKRKEAKKTVYRNLLFQPEIGLEMNTPFFLLRWHIAPSRPDSLFVSDTGLTLSWKYSY